MKVFTHGIKVSKEDAMMQYDFERFEDQCGDFYLIPARFKFSILEGFKDKKMVYMGMEEPNRFFSTDENFRGDKYDQYFYRVFTCCPYTMKWLNKIQGVERRQLAFIPINENFIPPKTAKKYDIIYVGNINSLELAKNIDIMSAWNYRLVARSHNVGFASWFAHRILKSNKRNKKITDYDVDHKTKMQLLSESKIALVHGLLYCRGNALRGVWSTPRFEDNEAFRLLPRKTWYNYIWSHVSRRDYLVPQYKTRFMEAAASRALMLCRKDPFNIIESYYVPDKEFVYYEEGRLKEKIEEILSNWSKYERIAEAAYERTVKEYTTQAFFEKFLKHLT